MKTGLIHIYTGEGKGKTTAAVGLAVRALGHGMKVCYAHFNKQPELYGYNEIQSLEKLGAVVLGFTNGHWSFNQSVTRESSRNDVKNGLLALSEFIEKESPDLLVMDEILISLRNGVLEEDELISFVDRKPEHLELVMTGRGASSGLIEKADYVSYIQKIKHPYDQKILSRKGIEY
ncbi:MAG TPA: cob(I)yrinic acid a,c-diamide adenosyltransferase [Prolixibacteraceae bacterium]|nr:cob(I)yrinic acid a,c-diamide adenosyltransferase [Prolixibacteraceae bacterium]